MFERRGKDQQAQLLIEAAIEIDRLRKVNRRLADYHDHTERMLALFEGGPRREVYGEEPGLAHKLRIEADKLQAGSDD